jgi:hypothetical protein
MRRLMITAAVLWLNAGMAFAQIASPFVIPPVDPVGTGAPTLSTGAGAMPAQSTLPTQSLPTDPLITNYGVGGMQRPPGAPNLGIVR